MWFSVALAVTPAELLPLLKQDLARSAASIMVRQDFDGLALAHGFQADEALYQDFVKVTLAFEATRDGGWIGNRWTVTNQEPNAKQLFAQYVAQEPTPLGECDELSALFSWTARQLGVKNTGLFWPTWNHTVGVWWFTQHGKTYRIVVPTSQVFIDAEQTLGTTAFDPWTQKTIYPYEARDFRGELPEAFVQGLRSGARCGLRRGLAANQHRRNRGEGPLTCAGPPRRK